MMSSLIADAYASDPDNSPLPLPTDDDAPDTEEIGREVDPDIAEIERAIPPPDTERIGREVDPDLATLDGVRAAIMAIRSALGWDVEHQVFMHWELAPTIRDLNALREEMGVEFR